MLTVKELRTKEVLLNVSSMKETAGANMEDARGDMNVILASNDKRSHLRDSGKLSGISGSSCDSHPTMPLSRSESGRSWGASLALLDFDVRFVAIRDNLLFELDLVFIRSTPLPSVDFRRPALMDATVV
jgi:hypothetical protein